MKKDRRLVRKLYESWNYIEHLPDFKRVDPEDDQAFADVDMPFLAGVLDETRDKDRIIDEDLRRIDILIYLIAIHAVIHQKNRDQYNRQSDGRLVLVASVDDYNAIVDVFNDCVYSEQTTVGTAEQEALLKVIPKMAKAGSMTVQELGIALERKERCIWGYVRSWKEAGLVAEEKENGISRFRIGPLLRDQCDGVDVTNSAKLVELARDAFKVVKGFRAEPLPSTKVDCSCPLHSSRPDAANLQLGANQPLHPLTAVHAGIADSCT